MKAAAKKINSDLALIAPLVDQIGPKWFWEMAPDKEKPPFVVFRLRENRRQSKDRFGDYEVKFFCIGPNMGKAADISEVLKDGLSDLGYRYDYGDSGYIDGDSREGYIELNYNFKI